MPDSEDFDVIVVGGGLSGGLTALRLHQVNPHQAIALVESGARLGGNHTWCFFSPDLSDSQRQFVAPLVAREWSGYDVHFPGFSRHLRTGYAAITSSHFHDVIDRELGKAVMVNARVTDVGANSVVLEDGQVLRSRCVLDARGPRDMAHLALGFQKFVALEMELAEPHGLHDPVVMDATVDQHDGYRFVYCLPFDARRVLVYDTYYSDGEALPVERLRERIHAYAAARRWRISSVAREEAGVLPIILAGDQQALEAGQATGAPRIGLGGGLFHPTTGYSLPDSVRLAELLAIESMREPFSTDSARRVVVAYGRRIWAERRYFRFLNRMLFKAGAPERRYQVLQRFYHFDVRLIQRFYAGRLNAADRIRIVVGKPPVPLTAALACLSEASMLSSMRR
jgi:lycopene beta-cyclase